jgi:hypothetical protein
MFTVPAQSRFGGALMPFRAILYIPALILFSWVIGTSAQPLPRSGAAKARPENQSVSGKISSVGDAEFTVAVPKDKDQQQIQNVEFFVDDKTRVEGKLAVGAHALVEYRSDGGRNIAVHIVVTQAAGAGFLSDAAIRVD